MKAINSEKAPKAVGPYSQAVESGNIVFCSGQLGLNPETGVLEGGVEKQARQALANLGAVLAAAGCDFASVTMVNIYMGSMQDFAVVNEVYADVFRHEPRPARVTVSVSELPKNAAIEISCIAMKSV